jgi:hypothetical protein
MAAERQAHRDQQVATRRRLDGQMQEQAALKQAGREADLAYFRSEQEDLRKWEDLERRRHQAQEEKIRALNGQRLEQLREKEERRARARQAQADDEAELAAKVAWETKVRGEAGRVEAAGRHREIAAFE